MKLERFKEKNNKKRSIIVFTICCILLIVGVFFYQSFALFETRENFNFIEGNVEDPGDLYFAFYIDDVLTYDMPRKESGYTMSSKSKCTNGVTITWDDESWSAFVNYENFKIDNSSRTKCMLYFEEKKIPPTPTDAVKDYIIAKAPEGQIIEDDETEDHNLRYIGSNPNNYVSFNNELWRIIGVMNNIDDGTGNKESRIKLIRNESIGTYSWDTSDSSVNGGSGINEWSQSKIMKLLNPGYESESIGGSLYWNSESGTCYNGENNATAACDFTSIGLANETKKFISKVIWHTGSNGEEVAWSKITTSKLYELERSKNTGKICTSGRYCNDTVERKITWTGYIGLMHPSDYGYATSGGVNEDRNTCLNNLLNNWESLDDCKNNNWMYIENTVQQTLTPFADDSNIQPSAVSIFAIKTNGGFGYSNAFRVYDVSPVLYLNANVKIIDGEGTSSSPFILSES